MSVEPEDVRLHELVVDAHLVQVGEALLRIRGGRIRVGELLRVRRREFRPAGLSEGSGAVQLPVADVPDVLLPPLVKPHVGDEVAPFRRDTRGPEVSRLDAVGVSVRDRVPLAESDPGCVLIGHSGALLLHRARREYSFTYSIAAPRPVPPSPPPPA